MGVSVHVGVGSSGVEVGVGSTFLVGAGVLVGVGFGIAVTVNVAVGIGVGMSSSLRRGDPGNNTTNAKATTLAMPRYLRMPGFASTSRHACTRRLGGFCLSFSLGSVTASTGGGVGAGPSGGSAWYSFCMASSYGPWKSM